MQTWYSTDGSSCALFRRKRALLSKMDFALLLAVGFVLSVTSVSGQEQDPPAERSSSRRSGGMGSRGLTSGPDPVAERIQTSLDYQEIRLLREKNANRTPMHKGSKDTDVEDLGLPEKAADEISRAQRSIRDKKPEVALEHLKKIASIAPHYSKVHNNMGLIYREMGRLQDAEAAFRKAIEVNPRNQIAQRNLGFLYIAMGRPENAVGPLTEAIRLDPMDASANAFLGDAMFRMGRMIEAETSLKNALQIRPNFYPAAYRLGCLYAQQKKIPEAIALLQQVLKQDHPGLETASVENLLSRLREIVR